MKPGIYYDISNEAYHSGPGLNASTIKALARATPARAKWQMDHPSEPSANMLLGTLVHSAVLEPETMDQYAVIEGDGRTKAVKDAKAAAQEAGQAVVTRAQMDTAMRLQERAHAHPVLGELLSAGAPEVSIYADQSGLLLRSREDWMAEGVILDLKTTQDAGADEFGRASYNFGYHIQAHHYRVLRYLATGMEARFLFACLETTPPYGIAVYEPDQAFLEAGKADWKRGVSKYRYCMERDEWPDHPEEVVSLSLPAWAVKQTQYRRAA